MSSRLPPGMPWHHPIALLSPWFGSGLIPFASGTWGSLAALPFAAAIAWAFGPTALIPAALLVFVIGIWASQRFAQALGKDDPSPVVIDEVAGQFLTLSIVPIDPLLYLLGFLIFRAADIWKPFPANWADQKLEGGLGIMLDDLIAGAYSAIALWAIAKWLI
jgi:phosphatidylglycerophosphatase A